MVKLFYTFPSKGRTRYLSFEQETFLYINTPKYYAGFVNVILLESAKSVVNTCKFSNESTYINVV